MLCRKHINRVAPHAKLATRKIRIVALVLHANQLHYQIALAYLVTGAQRHNHFVVALRLANTIDGRDGSNDDHIAFF